MTQKYTLIDVTMEYAHRTLYRIKALRDFGNVKAGDIGGWVESYDNLSQEDNCWIFDNAIVRRRAKVYRHAKICQYAKVQGDAKVRGRARVNGYATISGYAIVESSDDYIVLRNNWSSGRYFTYTRSNKMYKVGCFYGTGDALIEKAYKDSQLSGECYKASVLYVRMLEQAFAHNKQKQ